MYLKRTYHTLQRLCLLCAVLFVFGIQLWTTCTIAQTQVIAPIDAVDVQPHHEHTSAALHECCDESTSDTSLCDDDCHFVDGLSARADSVSVSVFALPSGKPILLLASLQAPLRQPVASYVVRAARHYVQIFFLVLTI